MVTESAGRICFDSGASDAALAGAGASGSFQSVSAALPERAERPKHQV